MKTITQMRDEINAILKKVADMRAVCRTEGRDLDKTERIEAQALLDEVDNLRELIAMEERTQKTIDAVESNAYDPIYPEQTDAETKAEGTETRTRYEVQAKKDRFLSFGEQIAAVMRAGIPGGNVDPRLLNTRAASGLNEAVPSDGGFLIQEDFSSELLKSVFTNSILAPRCRTINISGKSNSIKINGIDESSRANGSRWGGVQAYWEGEAETVTASKPKFRQIHLTLRKLFGLCYATDEMLNDATALGSVITQAFNDEFTFKLDDAIINGSGAGVPLGFKSAGCLVSVAKESGQTAATVVYENIVNMWSRLIAAARNDAVWLINQDVEPQLLQMYIEGSSGGVFPVYLPPGGISGTPYATLMGRPVIPIEQCQTLGTVGDIYLASLGSGYLLARKGGMKSDMSVHVRFLYDESVFKFTLRIDGQPVLQKAITPYKGSNTLSHFVALATRA